MDTYFKSLRNYESCVISNGKSYIFDRAGNCKRENAGLLPEYTTGAIRVNILSLVCANGRTEIAWDKPNGEFKKYETSQGAEVIMSALMMKRGYVRFLKRNGSISSNDVTLKYTQMLFIYTDNFDILSIIQSLNVKEIA